MEGMLPQSELSVQYLDLLALASERLRRPRENRSPEDQLNNDRRVLLGMREGAARYAIKAEIERSTRLYWGASVGGI